MRNDYYKAANKFPNGAYEQYRKDIVAYVDETEDRFRNIWESSLAAHVQLLTDDDQDRVERDLERVEQAFTAAITALAMERKISNMATQTRQAAVAGLRQELSAMLDTDFTPMFRQQPLDKFVRQTIQQNVRLIKSIASDQYGEIERLIYKGAREGWSKDKISQKVFNQFDVSRGRANVIAMDQTGSLQGSINKNIQNEQLGLERFAWIGIPDNRIREKHAEIASNIGGQDCYRWDDPPKGILPGMEVACRCWARPCNEELQGKFGGGNLAQI